MSANTVVGQKYERKCGAFAVRDQETNIFVPSYQLNIGQDGNVVRRDKPFETVASDIAQKKLFESNYGNITKSEYEALFKRTIEEADKTAFTTVQISKDLLDKIKSLFEECADHQEIEPLIRNSGILN